RYEHQEHLRDLDEPAAVEAIGEGARVDGQHQERDPVADDREPAEAWRVERLEDDPVAGDVLDALGGHADERQHEVVSIVAVVERPELRGGRWRGLPEAHRALSLTSSTILPVCASLSMYRCASVSRSNGKVRSSTGLRAPAATAPSRCDANRSLHWSDSSGVRVRQGTPMMLARWPAFAWGWQPPIRPALRPTLTSRALSASTWMLSASIGPPTWSMMTSTPRPPVARMTASTHLPASRVSTTSCAPRARSAAAFAGVRVVARTGLAPIWRATRIAPVPTPPGPPVSPHARPPPPPPFLTTG